MTHTKVAYPTKGGIGFSREPAAWVAVVVAALSIVAVFNWPGLTQEHIPLWTAVLDGVAAIVVAWRVRPMAPSLFTYLITGAAALATGYGVPVPDQLVPALNMFAVALIFAMTRSQQTPVADSKPTVVDGTVA
jgi:hypothetical protein